ncbi:MAG TPA: hypothetical protein VEO00_12455 [Actinomycetota bacterium]|nr:hypothetical protein [Actinomycetota bacterium]
MADQAGASSEAPTYTHQGTRYLLGYVADYYGIWDRQSPGVAVYRFIKDPGGWQQAWTQYVALEPQGAAPTQPVAASARAGAAPVAAPAPATTLRLPSPARRTLVALLRGLGWAALIVFPITGIAILAAGGGFSGVMVGFSDFVLGGLLWALGLGVAKVLEAEAG